jgi:hypothetical protein
MFEMIDAVMGGASARSQANGWLADGTGFDQALMQLCVYKSIK